MASMEPTEDEIEQALAITGLNPVDDRQMITLALKNNNRNVETVIGQYFDNEETFRKGYGKAWDDSMFTADRDGSANNTGIAFHIESPSQNDVIQGVSPPPENYGPGAPSRPPSRSNNRSPLGPNSLAQEDEDMQRALRASAQEAGIALAEQESGVTEASTSVAYFGPANRNDYEQDNWAMVPTGVSQTKMDSAPLPTSRKRAPNAPAFLVKGNSTARDQLGSLLTILHQIPLARNILLDTGAPAPSYGHNSEWWMGQEILAPHILAKLQTGDLQWGSDDVDKPNFEEEIHRLMAFLDQTERGYGTASVLTDLIPWPSIGSEKQFYEMLTERNGSVVQPLNQTAAVALVLGDDPGSEEANFGLLDMELHRSAFDHITTLYEAVDHVMWSDVYEWNTLNEESRMAMFREMGEVVAIKVGGDGPADSIDIPVELYPERWMASRKDEARRIQAASSEARNAIANAARAGKTLYEYRDGPNQPIYDKRELIKKTEEQWKVFGEYLESSARFKAMQESGFDTDKYPDYRAAPCGMGNGEAERFQTVEEVLKWTDQTLADLEEKMQGLEVHLNEIRAKQRFLGRLLTIPDKPGRPKPMTCNKFLLRGVATAQDVVYVCQRVEADLIELEDTPKPLDQWWRLSYSSQDSQPVKSEKVEIERVMRDMWLETKTPLLIYATEKALNTPRAPLSSALERFVRADNKAFRQEISREGNEASELKRAGPTDPMSPSKRKHRSDSPDSMDTNRASAGSEGGDNPFADPENNSGTDMMEMSSERDDVARSVDIESTMGGIDDLSWNAASGLNTSTTVTPNTLPAEETQSLSFEHEQGVEQRDDQSRTMTPEVEEARSPEMQERPRPPAFATLSRTTSEQKAPDSMDMEIPDTQD